MSTLSPNVYGTFQKFLENNCTLCFCSGRSRKNIDDLRKLYKTGDYGIAENGGIVIGADKSEELRGDKTEANKLIMYLQKNHIPFKIDKHQNNHRTEFVFTKTSINEATLINSIRDSKANVEYHSSKNTYHISTKNINKGSAIAFLTGRDELDLDPAVNETIGIGDSDLDIPMFEQCDKGYLVGKPERKLKEKLNKKRLGKKLKTLKKEPPHVIEELYDILFPYG